MTWGHDWLSIHRCTRTEYDSTSGHKGVDVAQQDQGLDHVVVVVDAWISETRPNQTSASTVDDSIRLPLMHLCCAVLIRKVSKQEVVWHALQVIGQGCKVNTHHTVSSVFEFEHDLAANETCGSCDYNVHYRALNEYLAVAA